jgi:DNA mismatch endonuclease (patch repair protein)
MSSLARRDTAPEIALRQVLFRKGLRYRVQLAVPGNRRRRIDIAFTRSKIAVFVDGCYWHGCPEHGTRPVTNREWWDWKIKRNRDRDQDTDRLLTDQGWRVIRVWEHEEPGKAAESIATAVHEGR